MLVTGGEQEPARFFSPRSSGWALAYWPRLSLEPRLESCCGNVWRPWERASATAWKTSKQAGSKVRKRAKQRLAKLREDAGEEWEDVEERWTKAKDRIRDIDLSGEDEDSSPLGTIVALAAGVAATYFLTSDRAAPVRSRVQGAASDMRRRASDQWDRFQRGGFVRAAKSTADQEPRPESRAGMPPIDDTPQAS